MTDEKSKLSKEKIITAALALTADSGVDALSFRRLASVLGVSPMALYRYFDDKQALLAAMLDVFIAKANVLPEKNAMESWQAWISYVARRMYQALVQQPTWLPLLGQLPLQASGLAVFDACLAELMRAGFSREQAVKGFFSLIQTLFGAAIAKQQILIDSGVSENQGLEFNNLLASQEAILNVLQTEQIEIGLSVLIAGLQSQLNEA